MNGSERKTFVLKAMVMTTATGSHHRKELIIIAGVLEREMLEEAPYLGMMKWSAGYSLKGGPQDVIEEIFRTNGGDLENLTRLKTDVRFTLFDVRRRYLWFKGAWL